MTELLKSKTFWTGVAGAVAGIGGYFSGEIDLSAAIIAVLVSLLGIFQRSATAKLDTKVRVITR